LEYTKKLSSIDPAALLASKKIIRAIVGPLTEPSPQRACFVEQRLAAMWIQWLDRLE
jgi:hypothetical protein